MTVLTVSDPPDNFEALAAQLAPLGLEIRRGPTCADALRSLEGAAQDLAQKDARLEALHSLQRRLTGCVVHDLKNPIGVVQANLDYALACLPRELSDVADALSDAAEGARQLLSLVNDLLLVSIGEHAEMPIKPAPIAVRPLLDELGARHARNAMERGVELEVAAGPEGNVFADAPLLKRMLDNLLDNALRYTPREGRIEISASVGDEIRFVLAHSGRAIPLAERERMFDQFARVAGNVEQVGPGVGLYFCRRAAEAHGGRIEVDQTREWDSRFVLHLPATARTGVSQSAVAQRMAMLPTIGSFDLPGARPIIAIGA